MDNRVYTHGQYLVCSHVQLVRQRPLLSVYVATEAEWMCASVYVDTSHSANAFIVTYVTSIVVHVK